MGLARWRRLGGVAGDDSFRPPDQWVIAKPGDSLQRGREAESRRASLHAGRNRSLRPRTTSKSDFRQFDSARLSGKFRRLMHFASIFINQF